MSIVYLTNDLMFSSRVAGAAKAAGVDVRVVGSVASLLDSLSNEGIRLVILDLTLPSLDPTTVLPEIRSAAANVSVIAYGPHVHEQKLAAAKDAGCDQVLSKGQFSSSITNLIDQIANSD